RRGTTLICRSLPSSPEPGRDHSLLILPTNSNALLLFGSCIPASREYLLTMPYRTCSKYLISVFISASAPTDFTMACSRLRGQLQTTDPQTIILGVLLSIAIVTVMAVLAVKQPAAVGLRDPFPPGGYAITVTNITTTVTKANAMRALPITETAFEITDERLPGHRRPPLQRCNKQEDTCVTAHHSTHLPNNHTTVPKHTSTKTIRGPPGHMPIPVSAMWDRVHLTPDQPSDQATSATSVPGHHSIKPVDAGTNTHPTTVSVSKDKTTIPGLITGSAGTTTTLTYLEPTTTLTFFSPLPGPDQSSSTDDFSHPTTWNMPIPISTPDPTTTLTYSPSLPGPDQSSSTKDLTSAAPHHVSSSSSSDTTLIPVPSSSHQAPKAEKSPAMVLTVIPVTDPPLGDVPVTACPPCGTAAVYGFATPEPDSDSEASDWQASSGSGGRKNSTRWSALGAAVVAIGAAVALLPGAPTV
ncbi:hypothetical protein B0T24DRAFT_710173, partial [Lasiosphaeria ovina]